MDTIVQLLLDNIEPALAAACYIIAGVIGVFGMGSATLKVVGDDHHTMRSVMPQVALTAIAAGVMILVGANIGTFLS